MAMKYRDPETLSNSDEEFHPNIDTKSYRKYIKETRATRYAELKAKKTLTDSEQKELEELEYKLLPVDNDVSEGTFRTSSTGGLMGDRDDDGLVDDLIMIFHNNTVAYFMEYVERKMTNLEAFEELIYLNLSLAIKNEDDEWGFELCKIGLMARWMREFGWGYMQKLKNNEDKVNEIAKEHYKTSKGVILNTKY